MKMEKPELSKHGTLFLGRLCGGKNSSTHQVQRAPFKHDAAHRPESGRETHTEICNFRDETKQQT